MLQQYKIYFILGAIAAVLLGDIGLYVKGRIDGKALYKAKIEREINSAVRKGDDAKANALRNFDALPDDGSSDASSVPNDGFQRP